MFPYYLFDIIICCYENRQLPQKATFAHHVQDWQGVWHTVALPFTLKGIS